MTNYIICDNCKCDIDLNFEKQTEIYNSFLDKYFYVCEYCANEEFNDLTQEQINNHILIGD